MRQVLLVLSVGLGLVALIAGMVAALAYGTDVKRDGTLEVEGVRQPVTLSWTEEGAPIIDASSLPDLALGLGYAHAADHAWTMSLWRQAGRGGLGAWFGPELRTLDRHARALGLGALAQRTYRTLDVQTRDLLDAYAEGVNAALQQPGIAQGDAFVLMDVEPEVWRPWDALVVERLVAYLATPAPASDSTWARAAAQDSSLHPFLRADSTFRATLGIGGTEGARAFVVPAAEGPGFIAHQPAGASALDLFAPVMLRLNGRTVAAATIPGTLSAPIGWAGDEGWALFLTSSMRLEAFTGEPPPDVHSRIVERDGDEVLISIPRDTSGLVLTLEIPPDAPLATSEFSPDSTSLPTGWRLRWSGFSPTTDVAAFVNLVTNTESPSFSLLRGDGLRHRAGTTVALGTPPVTAFAADVAFAGASQVSRYAPPALAWMVERQDTLDAELSAQVYARADVSLWAAQTLPPLLRALGDRDNLPQVLDTPYAFLKGWNHRYTPDAIAPSIFEAWLESHRDYTGHLPDPRDSLDVQLLPYTLRIAQASLRDAYGPEIIGWRWGRLQEGMKHPIASDKTGRAFSQRFAAPSEGFGGHPTSPFPGSLPRSYTDGGTGSGPATWSAWATMGRGLSVRPPAARLETPDSERQGPAIFFLGTAEPQDRPALTLVSPS